MLQLIFFQSKSIEVNVSIFYEGRVLFQCQIIIFRILFFFKISFSGFFFYSVSSPVNYTFSDLKTIIGTKIFFNTTFIKQKQEIVTGNFNCFIYHISFCRLFSFTNTDAKSLADIDDSCLTIESTLVILYQSKYQVKYAW